jgi:methylated-DNA-[protein]-cysteine S-methyltransferase
LDLFSVYYSSPIGLIELTAGEKGLRTLYFVEAERYPNAKNSILENTLEQLEEYFTSGRREFDISLDPSGTPFQLQVWKELLNIPFGRTISYLDLALAMGDKNSTRAVGAANGRNPISLIVPCHRVIGNDGKLTGYGGGLWRKQLLLEHEGILKKSNQPELFSQHPNDQ